MEKYTKEYYNYWNSIFEGIITDRKKQHEVITAFKELNINSFDDFCDKMVEIRGTVMTSEEYKIVSRILANRDPFTEPCEDPKEEIEEQKNEGQDDLNKSQSDNNPTNEKDITLPISENQPQSISLDQQIIEALSSRDKLSILQTEFGNDHQRALQFLESSNILNTVREDKSFKGKSNLIKTNFNQPAKCQKSLMDLYKTHPFEAFCLYLENYQKIDVFEPQSLNNLQVQVTQLSESADEELTEDISLLIDNLESFDFDGFLRKVLDLNSKNYSQASHLNNIIDLNCRQLNQKVKVIQQREDFIKFMGEEFMNDDIIKLLDFLTKDRKEQFIQYLDILLRYDQELRLKFVEGINHHYLIDLPSEKVFLLKVSNANIQKAKNILEFLENYSDLKAKHLHEEIKQFREKFETLLNDLIQNENKFFNQIIEHFNDKLKEMEVSLPKTFDQIRYQGLQEVNSQLFSYKDHQLKIEDFYEIDSNFNPSVEEQNLLNDYQKFQRLNVPLLIRIIFNYIKKKIDLNSLIKKFRKIRNDFPYTRSILLNFILDNSKEDLRILLIMSCSYFQPIPLNRVGYQKVNKNTNSRIEIYKEISFLYESQKSVLNFCHQEQGKPKLKNCESLINLALMKSFEGLNETYSNYDSFEIQFDYNLAKPQHIPVSNYHGFLTKQKLNYIHKLFNVFVIHTQIKAKQDWESLSRIVFKITQKRKTPVLIIIINHNEFMKSFEIERNNESNLNLQNQIHNIMIIKAQSLSQMDSQIIQNLAELLRKEIFEFQKIELKNYEENISKRIESTKRFLSTFKLLQTSKKNNSLLQNQSIEKVFQTIFGLINIVKQNRNKLNSQQFLPMNSYFSQLCKEEAEQLKDFENFNSLKNTERENKIDQYKKQLQQQEESKLIKLFHTVLIDKKHAGAVFAIISKIIKGYQDVNTEQIYLKRKDLKKKKKLLQNDQERAQQNEVQEEIEKLNIEISTCNETISNLSFSYEYILREFYLHSQYNNDQDYKDKIFRNFSRYMIKRTHPFEIIDGDNLKFISQVYGKIFSQEQIDELFVISVLGPQSAGKSLLLNYLFGTLFKSSEARCTKGVYGAMFLLRTEKGTCKRILVLDTEGIQAAEGRDEEFDRRIVFYILCVSNLVLICNKGEMNAQMAEVLKLAAETISKLQENIFQPKVLVVMNALTSTNNGALQESIQKLSEAIEDFESDQNKTQKLFQINDENVIMLPYAFNKAGEKEFIVNQPSEEFSEKLLPLQQKIYNCMNEHFRNSQSLNKKSTKDWFQFAEGIWDLSSKQKGYREYKTLHQKRQELSLRVKIQDLIQQNFDEEKDLKEIEELIKEELKKQEGKSQFQFQGLARPIEMIIQEKKYDKLDYHLKQEFEVFCKDLNISNEMYQRFNNQLIKKLCFQKDNWFIYLKQKVTEFQKHQSEANGLSKFNQKIEELLQNQKVYDKNQAEKLALDQWEEIENDIIKNLRKEEEIHDSIYQFIKKFYESQLKQNVYIHNDGASLLKQYKIKRDQSMFEYFEKLESFLFYQTIKTRNKENFLQTLEMNQKFIKNISETQVSVGNKVVTIYKWKQLLFEILDFDYFAQELHRLLSQKPSKYWVMKNLFGKNEEKYNKDIDQFFSSFQKELQDLNIKVDGQFRNKIFVEIQLIYMQNYFQKDKKLWLKSLKERIEDIIFSQQNNPFSVGILDFWNISIQHNTKYKFLQIPQQNNYKKFTKYEQFIKNRYFIDQEVSNDLERNHHDYKISEERQLIEINKDKSLPQEVEMFLKHLCCIRDQNSKHYLNQETTKSGINFVQSLIQIKYVIRKIEEIVLCSMLVNRDVQEDKKIHLIIEQIQSNEGKSKICDFRLFQNTIINDIACDVKQFITEMNEIFSRFLMKISEQGEAFLHLVAQTYLSALCIQLQIQIEKEPIYSIREIKQNQIEMFVFKLTNNEEGLDKNIAQHIAKKCFDAINSESFSKQFLLFQDQANKYAKFFEKQSLITNIESFAQYIADKDIPIKPWPGFPNFSNDQKSILQFLQTNYQYDKSKSDLQIQTIIEYFIDPKSFFSKTFEVLWDSHIGEIIKKYISNHTQKIKNQIEKIIQFFKELQAKLELNNSTSSSMNLFPLSSAEENIQKIRQIKETQEGLQKRKTLQFKAAAQYLIFMINNSFNPQNFNLKVQENSLIYQKLVDDILIDFGTEQSILPTSDQIKSNFEGKTTAIMTEILQKEKISSIIEFTKSIIHYFEELQNTKVDEKKLENDFIGQNLKSSFYKMLKGCNEFCPLCRKQCDAKHEADNFGENYHDCQFGHRIQGFGGNKYSEYLACNLSCTDMKDENVVQYEGETFKWTEFKNRKELQYWSFEVGSGYQQSNKNRNDQIWNHFGRLLCDVYKEKPYNLKINFLEANLQPFQKIHYLLCLDESYSMEGQKWTDLMSSVKNFMNKLCENSVLRSNSFVTVVSYNQNARIIFQEEFPNEEFCEKIRYEGGGTDFNVGLEMSTNIIEQCLNKYDKHILCFMTDGECEFPETQVQRIETNSILAQKIQFRGLFYDNSNQQQQIPNLQGSIHCSQSQGINQNNKAILISSYAKQTLEKMCSRLSGTFEESITVADLTQSFFKLIPNIYSCK